MADSPTELTGPDLVAGIPLATLSIGAMLQGHALGTPVLLVRRAKGIVAVGAYCTHYGAPLQQGLLDGDTVRCPWHHACFHLGTGRALDAPAFDALRRWIVDVRDDTVFVTAELRPIAAPAAARVIRKGTHDSTPVSRVVIVGGGAAGDAAAAMLRSEGYEGEIAMLSADQHPPGDRPNFSKGTISGTVEMDFNFVRPSDFYRTHNIDLRLNTNVSALDTKGQRVQLTGGELIAYDALLLATGAEPVRLTVPGADLPHVRTLRTLADSLAIAERASHAKSAVVVGASFIGMEVAAALRARDIPVHIVAPDAIPMARVLGIELGAFMRGLHERHGVSFHLGTSVASISADQVRLVNGEVIDADLVVVGIGVRPAVTLATDAGIATDNGVLVNARLETSAPNVYAAGDIARWQDNVTGARMRVEHWVVAQRQGQTAARNMLGANEPFDAVPFFWTKQYDTTLRYVGHAEGQFTTDVIGSLAEASPNVRVNYRDGERLVAVATIGRDLESLDVERGFEHAHAMLRR